MLDEELAPLLKQQGIAETAAGGVTVNASEQDRSTAEDGSLRDFLCHRATWLQLVDLLQLSEFLAFATYACCGDRRSLTDLLLRQMEKLEVTKEQLEVHFAAFTYTESLTMLRWREKLYEFPALSLINGTSANWKSLAMSTKTPKGNSKYLAYDDSNDLQRKNMILARLEAHEKSYPELRLDILEVGELRDLRASEFFWCAPKPEFCERVAQILSVALRDADARESNERLDYFLIAPPRDVLAEAAATSAADAIRAKGRRALVITGDVRDRNGNRAAVDRVVAELGALDTLVNNAGGTRPIPLVRITDQQADKQVDLNLNSLVSLTQAAANAMITAGKGGSIINVASIEGMRAAPFYAVYAACKAGMLNFTRTAAVELAEHGIRVNAIAPDLVPTEAMLRFAPQMASEEGRAAQGRYIPLGRAGTLDDCAGTAVFLASGLSGYVTGVTINVDGGTWASSGWTRNADNGWQLFS